MSQQPVIELVLMKPANGVDDAALLKACDDIMPFLREAGGYLRRQVLRSDDGQWVDVVYWNSLEEALQAADPIMSTPAGQQLGAVLDGPSVRVFHLQQVRKYD
jgi:hypothetical protein